MDKLKIYWDVSAVPKKNQTRCPLKVAFFQKVRWNFFRSPNLKKNIFQKTILSLKFKFHAQDIIFEIWRSEKRIALSEKKPPLGMFWSEHRGLLGLHGIACRAVRFWNYPPEFQGFMSCSSKQICILAWFSGKCSFEMSTTQWEN